MVRRLAVARLFKRPNSDNPTRTTPIKSVPQCQLHAWFYISQFPEVPFRTTPIAFATEFTIITATVMVLQ